MTFTDYAINIVLIGLVLLQIRDQPQTLRSLLRPVILVVAAAAYYLRSVPTSGHDLALEGVLLGGGLVLGVACALTTRVWRAGDGLAHSRAGVAAAALWVVGIGSRLAFELYSTHGGMPAITRFSFRHQITSQNAWVAALVMMALAEVISRLVVLRLRGRRALAGAPGTDELATTLPAAGHPAAAGHPGAADDLGPALAATSRTASQTLPGSPASF